MQSNFLSPPETVRGTAEAEVSTDGPPIPAQKQTNVCDVCRLPSDLIFQETDTAGKVGPRRCAGCVRRAQEDGIRAEALRRQPELAAELAKIRERRERQDELPVDPQFCTRHFDSPYRAGKPGIGFNHRGELCCAECLPPELNPAKLAERIAALESALAQQPAKASKKAGAQ